MNHNLNVNTTIYIIFLFFFNVFYGFHFSVLTASNHLSLNLCIMLQNIARAHTRVSLPAENFI